MITREYILTGIVQGVGLRPSLYRLARAAELGGHVQNRSGRVKLVLTGQADRINTFIASLPGALPTLARLDAIEQVDEQTFEGAALPPFTILDSLSDQVTEIGIPADVRMCADCCREIHDPTDRRYGYAFTTCTHCGPRYTVVTTMPYDRERTTLAAFPLCSRCQTEYEDPLNRRVHAESTACPDCGPQLWVESPPGRRRDLAPLKATRQALTEGRIVGVRGIGGYLLATDATDRDALARLRERKHRPDKPFALMARDAGVVRRLCVVDEDTVALLEAPEAPIVILDVRPDAAAQLPLDLISPDTHTLGMMLPTSPLHDLLFNPLAGDPTPPIDLLVMTSGNHGGEPLCISNKDARDRLGGIADQLLCHDRDIRLRNDDSIVALHSGIPQPWRRARGFAPHAVRLAHPLRRCALALGAELKNTIALGWGDRVVLSPHIGDLESPEACHALEEVSTLLPRFLEHAPDVVAVDLHPDMHSTRRGEALAREHGLPLLRVQHHHAHAAACLAEHGRSRGLALVFDGTGLGTDNTIWGAELLHVTPEGFERWSSFTAAPLPGGDAAVYHPARQLVGRWLAMGLEPSPEWLAALAVSEAELTAWRHQVTTSLNCPLSSSAGRLFDAAATALGQAPARVTYEGQAAIRLEACAARSTACPAATVAAFPFEARERGGRLDIDWSPAFRQLAEALPSQADGPDLALAFHGAVANAAWRMIEYGLSRANGDPVALTGGVFMNRLLNRLLADTCRQHGVELLTHQVVPPNDGGVALGQAVVAGR